MRLHTTLLETRDIREGCLFVCVVGVVTHWWSDQFTTYSALTSVTSTFHWGSSPITKHLASISLPHAVGFKRTPINLHVINLEPINSGLLILSIESTLNLALCLIQLLLPTILQHGYSCMSKFICYCFRIFVLWLWSDLQLSILLLYV